jgi:putative addiction module killer protein
MDPAVAAAGIRQGQFFIKSRIKVYQKDNGDCPFILWLESLDTKIRHRIKSRLARIAIGNLGEYKILGDGISELKFKFGSGYRIYYSELDDVIVFLLCAGDKKTQSKDIKLAKEYLNDYLEGENHG